MVHGSGFMAHGQERGAWVWAVGMLIQACALYHKQYQHQHQYLQDTRTSTNAKANARTNSDTTEPQCQYRYIAHTSTETYTTNSHSIFEEARISITQHQPEFHSFQNLMFWALLFMSFSTLGLPWRPFSPEENSVSLCGEPVGLEPSRIPSAEDALLPPSEEDLLLLEEEDLQLVPPHATQVSNGPKRKLQGT